MKKWTVAFPWMSVFIPMILLFSSCKGRLTDDILVGTWYGAINNEVHVYYDLSRKWDGSLTGFTGIPEFRQSGQPVERVSLKGDSVRIEEIESNQRYTGLLDRDSMIIKGSYTNLNINASWPMTLRLTDSIPHPARPQTPHKPYPYMEREVVYRNADAGIDIAGTLTIPKGKGLFPCALMITGSGQQNRDEENSFHHPFKVIADYLARNGVAVLRTDDRGVGGTTRNGPFFNSTTKDLEGDVIAGINFLKEQKGIDPERIGLIGHSEGGLIAAMAAAESDNVSFIVLLASPAGDVFYKTIAGQDSVGARAAGADDHETALITNWCKKYYNAILNEPDMDSARLKLKQMYASRTNDEKKAFEKTGIGGGTLDIDYAVTPHFRYFLSLNSGKIISGVKCPVLALMGDKDISGPPAQTLTNVENALKSAGNMQYKTVLLKGLNHSFQKVGDKPDDDIEETISPEVLRIISEWVKEWISEL